MAILLAMVVPGSTFAPPAPAEQARPAKVPLEHYGPTDTSGWYRDALRWDASPVDLSFLNESDKPAGRHGFVSAKGDALVFADGTPARFWGGNIAASAIFSSDKEQVRRQARRIAQLGYNLMRLHHHDSTGWVKPAVIDANRDDSQHLDEAALDKLDWWVKCLKDEGVYVWLDLMVGRKFKAGDGIGEGFAEIERAKGEAKGFNYFNPRVQELMKEFNHKYLTHVNPYTKLAYKDDPALMGVLVSNENDLTHHFGNTFLADKKNPIHRKLFTDALGRFTARTGLPANETGQTWIPGPSKLFLNDAEHAFNQAMLEDLRQIGVKVPVATGHYWGGMALYSLPSLTDGGVIDVHSYGKAEALSADPRTEANYIAWIAAGQVYGKPMTITEWNVEYPTIDRFTAPLYVASIACLQGWDAPMIYNYSQRPFTPPQRAETWSTFQDAGLTGMMPAAAIAFRQGHVSPARETYCLKLDRQQLFYAATDPSKSAAVRTLAETSRLTIGFPAVKELPWLKETTPAAGVKVVTDPGQDFIPKGQDFVQSDTGELRRDWAAGVQTIDAPKTQAAAGKIGGKSIKLKDVTFDLTTPRAAVAVTSLDGAPIARSKRILLTALARVSASPGEKFPMLSEPVVGTVTVRSGVKGLRLVPLAADGAEGPGVPVKADGNGFVITLPVQGGTHWFILKE